jgi:hypothetical protein
VRDITLVNILKALRYSSKPFHSEHMNVLFEQLSPRLDKYGILACLHIALLGTNLQNCHQLLIEKIIERFNKEITDVRLKDIERIALIVSLYDFESESGIEKELMKNILEELKKRVDEIVYHPKCLTSTVHYLTIKGVYDVDLIAASLKESFLTYAYGKIVFYTL